MLLLRSIREPGRLLVQEPQICTPQERVEETNDLQISVLSKTCLSKDKGNKALTMETLALLNAPAKMTSHFWTLVLTYLPLFKWQIECSEPKIQFEGSAAYFILITPLAHAALAASQKMAKIAVKQKS